MVRIRTAEEIARRWVKGCLEAFLKGKKDLNWIKGVIRNSGALQHEGLLLEIFLDLLSYEKLPRYQEILKACRKEGWL